MTNNSMNGAVRLALLAAICNLASTRSLRGGTLPTATPAQTPTMNHTGGVVVAGTLADPATPTHTPTTNHTGGLARVAGVVRAGATMASIAANAEGAVKAVAKGAKKVKETKWYKKCFPAHAQARRPNGDVVRMSELRLGDHVLGADGVSVTAVVAWLHRDASADAVFKELALSGSGGGGGSTQPTLTLTPNHLVLLLDGSSTFAKDVRVGDELMGARRVTAVRTVHHVGVFAPATAAGTLLVDGVGVSCYASFRHHALGHAIMAPLRWLHTLNPGLAHSFSPSVDAPGVHMYAAAWQAVAGAVLPASVMLK